MIDPIIHLQLTPIYIFGFSSLNGKHQWQTYKVQSLALHKIYTDAHQGLWPGHYLGHVFIILSLFCLLSFALQYICSIKMETCDMVRAQQRGSAVMKCSKAPVSALNAEGFRALELC